MKKLAKILLVIFIVWSLCIISLLVGISGINDKPVNLSPIPHQTSTIRLLIVPNDYTPTPDYDTATRVP